MAQPLPEQFKEARANLLTFRDKISESLAAAQELIQFYTGEITYFRHEQMTSEVLGLYLSFHDYMETVELLSGYKKQIVRLEERIEVLRETDEGCSLGLGRLDDIIAWFEAGGEEGELTA